MRKYEREKCLIWEDTYFWGEENWDVWREDVIREMQMNNIPYDVFMPVEDESSKGRDLFEGSYSKYLIDEYIETDNRMIRDDEGVNLNCDLPAPMLAYVVSERWDGVYSGVDPIKEGNLNAFLNYDDGCDVHSFYVEGEDIKLKGVDHDGTSETVFRMISPDLTEDEEEEFWELLENGKVDESIKYTAPLGDMVREVYGTW